MLRNRKNKEKQIHKERIFKPNDLFLRLKSISGKIKTNDVNPIENFMKKLIIINPEIIANITIPKFLKLLLEAII
jgi:hypothetical protein